MDETLYLTITRGGQDRPIVATSDPAVISAVAEALYRSLRGAERRPVLELRRALDGHEAEGREP